MEKVKEFQSKLVYPVVEVYCFHSRCPPWERRTIIQEFERIRYSPSPILSPKTWLTAIRYKILKKELMHIDGLLEIEHHDPQSPWVAYADETSNTHYYHNTVTGETSWVVPPEGVALFAGDDGGEYSEENYDY